MKYFDGDVELEPIIYRENVCKNGFAIFFWKLGYNLIQNTCLLENLLNDEKLNTLVDGTVGFLALVEYE